MVKAEHKSITIRNILDAIAYGHDLFNYIAADRYGEGTPLEFLGMSRKQYYTSLEKLIKVDLIRRRKGRYFLTPFGEVVYHVQFDLGQVVDQHFKFSKLRKNRMLKLRQEVGLSTTSKPAQINPSRGPTTPSQQTIS
jgi:DNA-binding IclR family transcriptional regulator